MIKNNPEFNQTMCKQMPPEINTKHMLEMVPEHMFKISPEVNQTCV